MKHIFVLSSLVFSVLTSGCTDSKSVESEGVVKGSEVTLSVNDDPVLNNLFGTTVTLAEFADAQKIDNLSAERQSNAFSIFSERYELASYLLTHDIAKNPELRVELADEFSRLVLDKYFEKYLENQVTDEMLKQYYDSHSEEFVSSSFDVTEVSIRSAFPVSGDNGAPLDQSALEDLAARTLSDEAELIAGDNTASPTNNLKPRVVDRTFVTGQASPQFLGQLSALDEGEWLAEPIVSPGVAKYYKLQRKSSLDLPFDQIKARLKFQLSQEAKAAQYKKLLEASKRKP